MQKFIQTYIIFKERVILQIVKLFFHNNLTDSFINIDNIPALPIAIPTAIKKASINLALPATKFPSIISRSEFVIASPGTNGINEPIIISFILGAMLNFTAIKASSDTKAPDIIFIKKLFVFKMFKKYSRIQRIIPINPENKESLKLPPKSKVNAEDVIK